MKTKPLFGNGNVPGNACPSNKGDNNTTIKKTSKTAESGDHLENQPNSKPVSNTDVVETRPKPSDNMVPNTEVNYNLTAEPVQYQSIVSPKTLLNGLTTPMCGGSSNSSRTVRIGTIRSVSSPMTFNIPSPHHYINSLVLVSTTMNCITHLPQPDPTQKQEVWRRTCPSWWKRSRAVRMLTWYWRRTGMSWLVTRLLLLMCTQRTRGLR